MVPMLKLHHAPTRRRASSRAHVHYPFRQEAAPRFELLVQIGVVAGIAAFAALELYIIVEMFQQLLASVG